MAHKCVTHVCRVAGEHQDRHAGGDAAAGGAGQSAVLGAPPPDAAQEGKAGVFSGQAQSTPVQPTSLQYGPVQSGPVQSSPATPGFGFLALAAAASSRCCHHSLSCSQPLQIHVAMVTCHDAPPCQPCSPQSQSPKSCPRHPKCRVASRCQGCSRCPAPLRARSQQPCQAAKQVLKRLHIWHNWSAALCSKVTHILLVPNYLQQQPGNTSWESSAVAYGRRVSCLCCRAATAAEAGHKVRVSGAS